MFRDLQQMQYETGVVAGKTSLSVELEKIASDKGFIISNNEGTGNCMFYALSEQLNLVKRIKISHAELRQCIVQYLKENPTLVSWRSIASIKWYQFIPLADYSAYFLN